MPRVAVESKHFFTFVKGLITEATGVTYPENSMVDGVNVDIDVSGICKRRKGIDFEDNYSLIATGLTELQTSTDAITLHEWESVEGDGNFNLWVLQIGMKLFIGSMDGSRMTEVVPIELDLTTVGTIERTVRGGDLPRAWSGDFRFDNRRDIILADIEAHFVDSADVTSNKALVRDAVNAPLEPLNSSYGKGRIFFTSKYVEPFFLKYDKTTDTIEAFPIMIMERDFIGVNDTLKVSDQPSTLSKEHQYNLRNQGWSDTGTTVSTRYTVETALASINVAALVALT